MKRRHTGTRSYQDMRSSDETALVSLSARTYPTTHVRDLLRLEPCIVWMDELSGEELVISLSSSSLSSSYVVFRSRDQVRFNGLINGSICFKYFRRVSFPNFEKKKGEAQGAFFPHNLISLGVPQCRQDGPSPRAVAGPSPLATAGWWRGLTACAGKDLELRNTTPGLVWSSLVRSTTPPGPPAKEEDQGARACSSRVANDLEKAVIVRLSVVESRKAGDSGEVGRRGRF